MTSQKVPSKDEFAQWKHSPTGQWFFEVWLQGYFQSYAQGLVEGETINTDSAEATALSTVDFVRKAAILYEVGHISYDEILTQLGIPIEEDDQDE